MRFSLKYFLLVIIALAIGIAWYVNYRESLGVEIRVPQPIALDDYYEIPKTLLEIRNRRVVQDYLDRREVVDETHYDDRIQSIRQRIGSFYPDSDQHLVQQRRDELVEIAQANLKDETDFVSAVRAALILDMCDQPEGWAYIKKRFLDQRQGDHKSLSEFFFRFRNRNLQDDDEVVAAIKLAAAKEGSVLYSQSCRLLHEWQIDSAPFVDVQRERAAKRDVGALIWLMENQTDEKTIKLVEEHLANSTSYQFSQFVRWAQSQTTKDYVPLKGEIARLGRQAEALMVERLKDLIKDPEKDLAAHQNGAWRNLAECCTEISADFFGYAKDYLGSMPYPDAGHERIEISSRALIRLGRIDQAKSLLTDRIRSTTTRWGYFGFEDGRDELYKLTEELLSREEFIQFCKNQCTTDDYSAVKKLAELFEGTQDNEIVDLFIERLAKTTKDGSRYWDLLVLEEIRRIGSQRLPELWNCFPKSKYDDEATFYHSWVKNKTTRQAIVDWINQQLKPKQKLTIARVHENAKYSDGNHWIWHDVMYDELERDENAKVKIASDQKFAMIALAHSGYGNLCYDDRFPLESVVDVMCNELADIESREFQVQDSDYDWDGPGFSNRFVVDGRLYKFSHSEGFNGSDDRYSTQAAVEVLNAVCIRRRKNGRFFCYANEWGVTLVMYLEPKQAMELESRFGIKPMAGFEYYLEN